MKNILQETTNTIKEQTPVKKSVPNRNALIEEITNTMNNMSDMDLVYDLKQCISILKNEELEIINDLKNSIFELAEENERLFKENADLIVENEYLKNINKN